MGLLPPETTKLANHVFLIEEFNMSAINFTTLILVHLLDQSIYAHLEIRFYPPDP